MQGREVDVIKVAQTTPVLAHAAVVSKHRGNLKGATTYAEGYAQEKANH
jgi:hypothetical protein